MEIAREMPQRSWYPINPAGEHCVDEDYSVKRNYKVTKHDGYLHLGNLLENAKEHYRNDPDAQLVSDNAPFAYCIVYAVPKDETGASLKFFYQDDLEEHPDKMRLRMRTIHKRPRGATPGEQVRNIDIREVVEFIIPPWAGVYYVDFALFILDTTTMEYWGTHYWSRDICHDTRFYKSRARREQYEAKGRSLAEKYNRTFMLGFSSLRSGQLVGKKLVRRLSNNGWLPGVSLMPEPYVTMMAALYTGQSINDVESHASSVVDDAVLRAMLERWSSASLARTRMDALKCGVNRILEGDFISAVYVLLPQIEGLVTDHVKRRGRQPEHWLIERFVQFGDVVKSESFNTEFTGYLADILVEYVRGSFFKTWYPYPKKGKTKRKSTLAPQRHTLMHGAIHPKYFSRVNCLKVVATLDSIILLALTRRELTVGRFLLQFDHGNV